MKRKRNRNIGGVDRISELPEGIIHGIMSLLSSKEVAQTCVLSKKWFDLKRNYPALDFTLPHRNIEENSAYLSKIRQAIHDSLNHFSSNQLALQTFSLNKVILGQPGLPNDLDRWIKLAVENGVKELNLYAKVHNLYLVPQPQDQKPAHLYTLPQSVVSSQTLTILELSSCYLDLPISMFSSLRKLGLSECILKGPIILKDTDCPILEEFKVDSCMGKGFKSICISNLLRLHTVAVNVIVIEADDEFVTVDISSQSIRSLALLCEYERPWSDINIHGCDNLKSLYLMSEEITDAELNSLLSSVPLLEELYLFNCCSLKIIKTSSSLLRTLEIIYEFGDSCCDLIEVSAPNLEIFIYKSFLYDPPPVDVDTRIEVADCCRSLKTLVLFYYSLADEVFHNLISRFPLLENIWIIRCNLLRRINIPNPQLKRLHFVKCSGLEVVEISSPNLSEVCFTGRKVPKFGIADDVFASGLRGKGVVHSSSKGSLSRMKETLKNFIRLKNDYVWDEIVSGGARTFD